MAGRWFRLTLRALYDKAIDVKDIGTLDSTEQIKQSMILGEAERLMYTEHLKLTSMAVSADPSLKPAAKSKKLYALADKYKKQVMPWLESEEAIQEITESSLIELYYRTTGKEK